jgi:hypothetical protein
MNINLIGRWRNEYGSILDIQSQGPSGNLLGIYTSETGASGTYMMNGWSPDVELSNQPVTLSVFWKPTDNTVVDPSWNWVSTMTGVLLLDTLDLQPAIQLLHGMVASTPFEAVEVHRPGVYTESLKFLRAPVGRSRPSALYNIPRGGRALKQGTITLTNVDPNSRYGLITFTYADDGVCAGTMGEPGQQISVQGFIDPVPPANIQSLSLTGMFTTDRTYTFGLGGFIDLGSSTAALDLFESNAVTYPNKYTSVTVSQEKFAVSVAKHSVVKR